MRSLFPLLLVAAILGFAGCRPFAPSALPENRIPWTGGSSPATLVYAPATDIEGSWLAIGEASPVSPETMVRAMEARVAMLFPDVAIRVEGDSEGQILVHLLDPLSPIEQQIIEGTLRTFGALQFLMMASDQYRFDPPLFLDEETERAGRWEESNPDLPLACYHQIAPEQEGPHPRLLFFRRSAPDEDAAPQAPSVMEVEIGPLLPVIRPLTIRDWFGAADLGRVYPTNDDLGLLAIGFEFVDHRQEDFERVTRDGVDRTIAMVVDGAVQATPRIAEPLPGQGIIHGGFSNEELKGLIDLLHYPDMRSPIRFVERRIPEAR